MTLEELEDTLPNGFHDLLIRSLLVDYGQHRVVMLVSVLVGVPEDVEVERDRRREGKLTLDGLQFISLDPPDPSYPFTEGDTLWVEMSEPKSPPAAARSLTPGCFVSGFFVKEWNSFIHVAARAASLEWVTETDEIAPTA